MNETEARSVIWVRALERSELVGKLITDEERAQLARTAAELTRWQSAGQGVAATAEAFVVQRAILLGTRIGEKSAEAARLFQRLRWRPWLGLLAPLLALLIGALAEHIVDRHRLNLLAFPLLALIFWNLAIYLWLLLRLLRRQPVAGNGKPGPLHSTIARLGAPLLRKPPAAAAQWHEDFIRDWITRSAPLTRARLARILHSSAALLAIGAVAGLYLRGLLFEYRAGWESTFLDASMVHAILSTLLQPFANLLAQPFPDVAQIAALRWDRGDGENAAAWIHLYTLAVLLLVILPRLLLAAIAWLRERALARHFPLSLDDAYFRRALTTWRTAPAYVRVRPYAYTPDEQAAEGLRRLIRQQFGDDVQLHVFPVVAFGDEDAVEAPKTEASPKADLDIVLFNLAATPEPEHHGVLLDRLQAKGNPRLAVLVDESAYRARLGPPATAAQRLGERRQAWTGFAAAQGLILSSVDLQTGDRAAFEQAISGQIAAADERVHAH